ncbi:hypothetical protein E2C01_055086 [Portunus trituberculatus]|uniref:Uncharacterized protein n=1 Tax=Portunus trituberculatus TaxID=210409 RepID=A0A5B7GWN8_PORTR|nr:hypothetical protein [Portunus trituberculatus]
MVSTQSQSESSYVIGDQSQHSALLGTNQRTVFKGERQYEDWATTDSQGGKLGQAGGTPMITGLWTPHHHHQYVLLGGLVADSGRGETLVAGGRDEELESKPLESGGAEVGLAVQGPQQWVTALQEDKG